MTLVELELTVASLPGLTTTAGSMNEWLSSPHMGRPLTGDILKALSLSERQV